MKRRFTPDDFRMLIPSDLANEDACRIANTLLEKWTCNHCEKLSVKLEIAVKALAIAAGYGSPSAARALRKLK